MARQCDAEGSFCAAGIALGFQRPTPSRQTWPISWPTVREEVPRGRAGTQGKAVTMYPIVTADMLYGGWELICCGFTAVAAVLSYLFAMR
jgi:hypothetical protein